MRPEPPKRYVPGEPVQPPGENGGSGNGSDIDGARRLVGISQIMAIASFLIGGIVLSGAALVVAIMGLRKASSAPQGSASEEEYRRVVSRAAKAAVAVAAVALVVNAIAFAYLYPLAMEALQSGNLDALYSGPAPEPSSSSSFWN